MAHLGLVSISFRQLSPETIIAEAKKAGLSCIEWGSDVHAPCHDTEKLKKIACMQQKAGLFCSSYGTYFKIGVHKTEELLPYIKAAQILGADILRLWCGDKGSAEYTQTELEVLYRQCREAAALAEKYGVTLCMECHNHTLTDKKEAAHALMQAVNSPNFCMYWQPNQFCTQEENTAYAMLLANDIRHVHVFHWKQDRRLWLEDAQEMWKSWLKCIFDVKNDSQIKQERTKDRALLLEFMPDDRIESLQGEAQVLRKIAEEWL